MSDERYYVLQVICVERNPNDAKDAALYVEVKLKDTTQKTGTLNSEGKPTRKDKLTFSRSDNGDETFDVYLKKSAKCIGHVNINAAELLQESVGTAVPRNLVNSEKLLWPRRVRSEDAGSILLHLEIVDAQTRAQIEANAAEESAKQINALVKRTDNAAEVAKTVIDVVDAVIGIVDNVVQIHPVANASWQAATALYRAVSHQLKTESDLVDLVDKNQKTCEFCTKAENLEDRTELLKPIIKSLLEEIIQCSRFVQKYSGRNLFFRTIQVTAPKEVEERSERLDELRKELDSIIGLHTAYANQLREQLDKIRETLDPFKSTSVISDSPRCFEDTRKEYLTRIMDFVSLRTTPLPNVFWLSGVAGCWKSTVAVTASDRCTEKGYQPVHLFFRRDERGKGKLSSIVRTIAYELASRYPPVAREVIEAIKRNNNIKDSKLEVQFKELLVDPLQNVFAIPNAITGPVVIILDSLDESGSLAERQNFLRLLETDFAQLPAKVRILVTSRPEEDIKAYLSSRSHISRIELTHGTDDSRHDVDRYITYGVKDRVKGYDDEVQVLCKAADGLFVWASTAVKMVQGAIRPQQTLERLAKDIRSVAGYDLNRLYATAFEESGVWQDLDTKDDGTAILGLILVAKEAMTSAGIEGFLGLKKDEADPILKATSICSIVRAREASSSAPRVLRRLSIIIKELQQGGLKQRIEDAIRPHLDYACRFWAAHVCELPLEDKPTTVLSKLKEFMERHLLYWFEVLSLTEQYDRVAIRTLLDASQWATSIDKELNTHLWEAYRLASVFAYPISQSAPHIYLSAISLWKGESPVADLYSETHPVVKIHRLGKRRPTQCIKILKGHTGPVNSVSISPDGRFIASGSSDGTICVWDAGSGRPMWSFDVGSRVGSVAFSPDSKQIVSGTVDETIRVVNIDTGELISGPFKADELKTVSYADGNRVILVLGYILYFENGEFVSVLVEDEMRYLAVSSDGKFVLGAQNRKAGIWDAGTGKRVSEFDVDNAKSYAVSPDRRVVTGSYDGTICVFNDRGELVTGPFKAHSSTVFSLAFSQDGKRVVSGDRDRSIAVWDADNGRIIWGPFNEHTSYIMSVIFTPDGKRVISASFDNTIRIWDVGGTDAVSSVFEAHTGWVNSVAFSADGKCLASGSDDRTIRIWGIIRIWDANSGKLRLVLEPLGMQLSETLLPVFPTSVTLLPVYTDGKRIISGIGTICIWDAETGKRVSGPRIENVISVALSPDGRRIVSASKYDTISIWDMDSGDLVLDWLKGHTDSIYSLALSPDGKRFASGSLDKTIRIWNVDSGELVSGPFKTHTSGVWSVAFSPNNKLLVSGSEDKTICVWDVDSGELVLVPLKGHYHRVTSVMFSPVDENRVVSCSADKTIRMWDVSRDGIVAGDAGKRATDARSSYDADKGVGLYSRNSARMASADRKMSKWTLCGDGWVKGEEGELLIWIPEDMRASLWTHRTIAMLSCQFSTKLDLLNSPVGEDWSKGYPRKGIRRAEVADLCLCFEFHLVLCMHL
ncbi:hypothetical protein ACEPAI_6837 [Sanghuangporus weigelae]